MQKIVGPLQKQTENGEKNKKQNPQHSMKVSYFFPPKNVTKSRFRSEPFLLQTMKSSDLVFNK